MNYNVISWRGGNDLNIVKGDMLMRKKKVGLAIVSLVLVLLAGGALVFLKGASMDKLWPGVITTLDTTIVAYPPSPKSLQPGTNDVVDFTLNNVEDTYNTSSTYGRIFKDNGVVEQKRYDILESQSSAPTKPGTQLMNFFSMSDIHITDILSPAQPLFLGDTPSGQRPIPGMSSAYSPSIPYSTQMLDAAVKKINSVSASNEQNKMTFGLMLGDAINSAQKNEVQMYLDTLSGNTVNPNSDLSNNYKTDFTQPFKAEGLKMPWYQVLGNHDHFWSGVYNSNDKLEKALVGDSMMLMGTEPYEQQLELNEVYGGMIDPADPYGRIIKVGVPSGNPEDYKITPNPNRSFVKDTDFISMFPKGHGINDNPNGSNIGCYTFEPDPQKPLRVIVFNNTAPQDTVFATTPRKINAAYAFVTTDNFKWLQEQLAKAEKDNKLVIVAMHIPTGMVGLWSASPVKESEFVAELNNHSNVLLLLAGHRHLNTVIPYASTKQGSPEYGFWQVETPSLRDFPQQFRMYKIVLHDNGIVSIHITDTDPDIQEGSMLQKARGYAITASQLFPEPLSLVIDNKPSRVYNAVLYKKISSEMQAVLNN
jgi:metallophosphoesterase (TIGR03768 family)